MAFYKSIMMVHGKNADALMYRLWHFSQLFPSFSFQVNGHSFTIFSNESPKANMIKESGENIFILFFDTHIEGMEKDMKILNDVLSPFYAPPVFSLVDES